MGAKAVIGDIVFDAVDDDQPGKAEEYATGLEAAVGSGGHGNGHLLLSTALFGDFSP